MAFVSFLSISPLVGEIVPLDSLENRFPLVSLLQAFITIGWLKKGGERGGQQWGCWALENYQVLHVFSIVFFFFFLLFLCFFLALSLFESRMRFGVSGACFGKGFFAIFRRMRSSTIFHTASGSNKGSFHKTAT